MDDDFSSRKIRNEKSQAARNFDVESNDIMFRSLFHLFICRDEFQVELIFHLRFSNFRPEIYEHTWDDEENSASIFFSCREVFTS